MKDRVQDGPEQVWLTTPAFPGEQTMAYRESNTRELVDLSMNPQRRKFRVRAVISDQGQPINWSLEEAISFTPRNRIQLPDGGFSAWKHYGGTRAVFHDFCTDSTGNLFAIELDVSARRPELALGYARAAVNQLLDSLRLPVVILRLEIQSLRNSETVMAYQITMPNQFAAPVRRFGGFGPSGLFAGADAILREAVTNPSPHYRLLLAYKGFEGTKGIRRELAAFIKKHNIQAPELEPFRLDKAELGQHGFTEVQSFETLDDLVRNYKVLRDGAAHFFLGGRGPNARAHLHLSSTMAHTYAKVASLMLEYLGRELAQLRGFHNRHVAPITQIGMILPLEEAREEYLVVCPDDESTAPPDDFN
jgi:hypothetical protein